MKQFMEILYKAISENNKDAHANKSLYICLIVLNVRCVAFNYIQKHAINWKKARINFINFIIMLI